MPSKGKEEKSNDSIKLILPEEDPFVFLKNYKIISQHFGVKPIQKIIQSIENDHNSACQLIVTSSDEEEFLGPQGCQALVCAILGESCDSKYIGFKDIRIIGSKIGNVGASTFARLLSQCDDFTKFRIIYLDLTHNDIDSKGCLALGRSLCVGLNTTLLTLKLDHNKIEAEGLRNLARGLAWNKTLKRLSLRYCSIDGKDVRDSIANILLNKNTCLLSLDFSSNNLGGEGLDAVTKGLEQNTMLQSILLADNCITSSHIHQIELFSMMLSTNKSLLEIDLSGNFIGVEAGELLANGLSSNLVVTSFKVDTTLNDELYDRIFRRIEGKRISTVKKKKK